MEGGKFMSSIAVDIQPEIINWALNQTNKENIDGKLLENIIKWLDGTKSPTFNQIEEFSKKSCIPLGYFFLEKPPKEKINLIDYRTIDSVDLIDPSRDLIDTVFEMETIQDWMATYRQEMGFDKCVFLGLSKEQDNPIEIAKLIRSYLEAPIKWYKSTDSVTDSFKYWRNLLNQTGVVVMMNGVVRNNTHRTLNTNEFRAFAMANDWAPLIFINASDTHGARLFSLLHEATHIALGTSDLFNDRQNTDTVVSSVETLCNAVAAELLVPNEEFIIEWNKLKTTKNDYNKFSEIAGVFHCGVTVIARRAFDNKFIDFSTYKKMADYMIDKYNKNKKNKSGKGGNYYSTIASRLDKSLVRAICESIATGRTSYTEAFRLTNTNKKTFPNVVNKVGGVSNW